MDKHRTLFAEINKNKLKSSSYFDNQKELFHQFLSKNVATCEMVEHQTGINRKNLNRYKTELEEDGLLKVLFIGTCQQTGVKAQYLTTNPIIISSLNFNKGEVK